MARKKAASKKLTAKEKRLERFGWKWEQCGSCSRETWRRKGQQGPLVCGVCKFDQEVV